MVTRRALVGAGALLVVGCGPPDEPEPAASEVWGRQLQASLAAAAAYPPGADVARLRERARSRVDRVTAALEAAGGTPPGSSRASTRTLDGALAAEHDALQAHVAGIGLLEDRASRELLASLVAETSAAEAELRARVGHPFTPNAFPGQPDR